MGISNTMGESFRRASISAGNFIPNSGTVFISVNEADKLDVIPVRSVFKVGEGRPNVVDGIKNDEINLVINTPMGAQARYDDEAIGRACIQKGIVAITTLSGAEVAVRAIRSKRKIVVKSIQEYHS
jgi:carbamoyl-phosphate synthase large subunit